MENGRLRVDEEITRASGIIRIQVDAALNGAFHSFSGSPIADEIAYRMEGKAIVGTARKNGMVSLCEIMTLPEPRVMAMRVDLIVEGRSIELGSARFNRAEQGFS